VGEDRGDDGHVETWRSWEREARGARMRVGCNRHLRYANDGWSHSWAGKGVDEGTTPRVLIIGIPVTAQEQDGHSKPKKDALRILAARRWQHARGLRLDIGIPSLDIGIPSLDIGNTLGGCASNWHSFTQRWQHARGLRLELAFLHSTLATRSGVVPRIGIPSLDVGNTLGGYASNWHSFTRHWQHARGLRLPTRC
jgi:hypothetical protein